MILDIELETFEKNREMMVGSSEGKFALIKGDKIIGIYAAQLDALQEGYGKFCLEPFLVKRVERLESPVLFMSNNLGV